MSVTARCVATPRICDSTNGVAAVGERHERSARRGCGGRSRQAAICPCSNCWHCGCERIASIIERRAARLRDSIAAIRIVRTQSRAALRTSDEPNTFAQYLGLGENDLAAPGALQTYGSRTIGRFVADRLGRSVPTEIPHEDAVYEVTISLLWWSSSGPLASAPMRRETRAFASWKAVPKRVVSWTRTMSDGLQATAGPTVPQHCGVTGYLSAADLSSRLPTV